MSKKLSACSEWNLQAVFEEKNIILFVKIMNKHVYTCIHCAHRITRDVKITSRADRVTYESSKFFRQVNSSNFSPGIKHKNKNTPLIYLPESCRGHVGLFYVHMCCRVRSFTVIKVNRYYNVP